MIKTINNEVLTNIHVFNKDVVIKHKITIKEAKEKYIYKDKSFDWDQNYIDFIKEYCSSYDFSYDIDNRCNCIGGTPIDDLTYSNIIDLFKFCEKIGMTNQNKIKSAITKLCKANQFSNKKIEREKKKAEIEEKKEIEKQEREKKKEEKEKKKAEIENNKLNILENYIRDKYSGLLAIGKTNNKIYYNDAIMSNNKLEQIILDAKMNCPGKINNKDIKLIINKIANFKKISNNVILNGVNTSFNLLDDVDLDNYNDFFDRNDEGELKHTSKNYAIFFRYHPEFKDKIVYNEFDKIEYLKQWDECTNEYIFVPIDDTMANMLKSKIEQYFGDFSSKHFEVGLTLALQNKKYHEIKDKIMECCEAGWDGIERVREIFIKYFDAENCDEIKEITEIMLCGALQRILEEKPSEGTAFDYMLVQFGIQGSGKTKFINRLFFNQKYVIVNPELNKEQDWVDKTNRAWCVLFDEMASINKADLETVKTRLTTQGNTCRLSYARRSKYYPIHCVYFGNTNYQYIFRDEEYERRFLCMECPSVGHSSEWWNENYTDYDIQQIWAEAFEIYKEKYKGKIIEPSDNCKEYNKKVQFRHKVAISDRMTSIQIEDIINWNGWSKYFFNRNERYKYNSERLNYMMKGEKNTNLVNRYKLKYIYCDWITTEFNRKDYWIDAIMTKFGWSRRNVDGIDMYINDNNLTEEEIINDMDKAKICDLVTIP